MVLGRYKLYVVFCALNHNMYVLYVLNYSCLSEVTKETTLETICAFISFIGLDWVSGRTS